MKDNDHAGAISLLQMGLEYTHMQGVTYTYLLFMLSKLMVNIIFYIVC